MAKEQFEFRTIVKGVNDKIYRRPMSVKNWAQGLHSNDFPFCAIHVYRDGEKFETFTAAEWLEQNQSATYAMGMAMASKKRARRE